MPRPRSSNPRSNVANVRLTDEEQADMKSCAARLGYKSISEYLRSLHETVHKNVGEGRSEGSELEDLANIYPKKLVRSFSKTRLGEIFLGDSRAWLLNIAKPGSVDLIITSPPFGLVRKKATATRTQIYIAIGSALSLKASGVSCRIKAAWSSISEAHGYLSSRPAACITSSFSSC